MSGLHSSQGHDEDDFIGAVPGGTAGGSSELFTVRLWREDLGDNQIEWRGKVQHVQGGEAFYFREWSMLIAARLKMLPEPESHAQTD